MKNSLTCLLIFATFIFARTVYADLLIYAGAASQPPTEEAAREFEEETGIRVDVIFGGSGYVLSQMKLAGQGDLYFPGSSDYMEKAKREGDVLSETEQRVVYLVNAINVPAGNPKKIHGLTDLLEPGLRIAIANPDGVCVGGLKGLSRARIKRAQPSSLDFPASRAHCPGSCPQLFLRS